MTDLPISEALINQIATQSGLDQEQVSNVLASLNIVRSGPPIGTVMREPDTGTIAHRIADQGVFLWRCTAPDGGQWNDTQPTLSGIWETLFSPESTTVEPSGP